MAALVLLLPVALPLALPGVATAQTLDVEPAGAGDDDLRFTWTSGTDDLLRGTSPDALTPWLTMVDSPLVVPGENALGAGDAWYRLASGSNMAFRLERDVTVDGEPTLVPISLPERRADVTGCEVLARYPAASQVLWYDGNDQRREACGRIDGMLLGDDEPLPPHGGVFVNFTESTTVRLVGSSDPSVGWRVIDFEEARDVPLGVPANARLLSGFELLCGEKGIDWIDSDGDTFPDECGMDRDGDGRTDTGAWASLGRMTLGGAPLPTGLGFGSVRGDIDPLLGGVQVAGEDFVLVPGEAVLGSVAPPSDAVNDGFRPPTW